MPDRVFATRELATLLGVLAHPERIRIVEELRNGELDVASLQKLLGVAHSRVSQNLGILRSHRIVAERREGRHVFYRLVQPGMAGWLLEGMKFLEAEANIREEIRSALGRAREMWSSPAAASGDTQADSAAAASSSAIGPGTKSHSPAEERGSNGGSAERE